MRRITHLAMALSAALIISIAVGPAVSVPPADVDTLLDRHHLLYGTVIPDPTDAPFGMPGGLYVCLSCHERDAGTGQFLIERDCQVCHQSDRHHIRYDTVIPDPTDAPYGASGELFVCFTCHEIDTSAGYPEFPVERDCRVCHRPAESKPIATDDSYTTVENKILHVPAPGVLGNDSDADGNPLTANLVSDVSSGVLAIVPDGSFVYVPEPDFVGHDSFTYVANNGLDHSNIATVTILVTEAAIKDVVVDIMPGSDRNPINLGSRGVLTVAILGSAGCDVTEIDVSSLLLEGQVAPLRSSLKAKRSGYKDLKLMFDSEAVNDALRDLQLGQTYEVSITGALMDGTPIFGSDSVVVVAPYGGKGRNNKGKGGGK